MSHLIEEYAKNLGVKIGKPIFPTHYIPVVDDKYITIHIDNKFDSRYYEYFPEVINLLKGRLIPNGYKIYQIGGANDPFLENVDKSYLGLSIKQKKCLQDIYVINYDIKDEEIRYDDLFMLHGGKFIYIRFNPDKFKDKNGKSVNPMLYTRLNVLKEEIEKQINRIEKEENDDLLEIVKLYYNE